MAPEDTKNGDALAPNDPYRNMDRQDTRPDFDAALEAKSELAAAERSATASVVSTIDGGADEAKSTEQDQMFNPRFVGKGRSNEEKKGKGKGFLKRKGPMIAILLLLAGGGGMMVGSQMLMPFATANRIIEEFNSMKTIMNRRADKVLRFQMDTDRYKSPSRKTIFGNDRFKISGKQARKLGTQGIDYLELNNVGGKPVRVLVFDDGSGVKQPILTETDMKRVGKPGGIDYDALKAEVNTKLKAPDSPDLKFKSSAMSVDSAFEVDGFKYGYLKSSKTWKGNIAGWFDSLVLKVFDRLGISRSRFKKWRNANNVEAGNVEFRRVASNAGKATDGGARTDGTRGELDENGDWVKDDGGNRITEDVGESGDANKINPGDPPYVVQNKLFNKARAVADLASGAGKVANLACAAMAIAGTLNAVTIAAEIAQILNYTTGYLEAVQKVQAGDGDGSPMIHYTNALTTPDKNGTTGMGASGIGSLFSNSDTYTIADESANKFNLEHSIKIIGKELKYTIDDMLACSYAKFAAGAVDAAADLLMLIGTAGLGTLIKKVAMAAGFSIALQAAVSGLMSVVIPGLAELITRDLINGAVGEDLGNAIRAGGSIYLGRNHQGGGGSPGDVATVTAYRRETATILAEEAEYDRRDRSPFDATSQNTFLGSLLYSMIPIANSTSSMGFLSNFGSLAQNSLSNLLPTASALADTRLITQQGDCPTLDIVGVMGDAYCIPYYTSDLGTIGADPGDDIFETVAKKNMTIVKEGSPINPEGEGDECEVCDKDDCWYEYGASSNFKYLEKNDDDPKGCLLDIELDNDTNMNPVINLDSELGKYIVYCGQRESQFGVADNNIASMFQLIKTGSSTVDGILSSGLGAIPILGGVLDATEAANEQENAPWIGGAACVASEKNDKWVEIRYYQRYMEDQRLLEATEVSEKSAVTVALEEHYEANPIDKSWEGVLARYSGLTKEQVVAALEFADYASFLAEYDPTDLAPVAAMKTEVVSMVDPSRQVVAVDQPQVVVLQHVLYADVRTRNYMV